MKSLRFIAILPLLCTHLIAPAQFVFQKLYGGAQDEYLEDVKPTNDGGYILAGYTYTYGAGNADFWAVKTDAYGNIQWNRAFGSAQRERAYGVIQTNDGGYLLTGAYLLTGSYDEQMVLKLNNAGNQQWVQYYSGVYDEEAYKAIELPGGAGFRACGLTDSYGASLTETSVITANNTGNVLTSSYYGGGGQEFSRDICATADGGFVITGSTTSIGAGNEDLYIVKYNLLGNVQWAKSYGGAGNEHGWSIRQTADGGFIAAGFTATWGSGNEDMYVIKTDGSGNLTWAKAIGGTGIERAFCIRQTSDGGYAVVGRTNSFGYGNHDVYVTKLTANGALSWSRCFGGAQEDVANAIEVQASTMVVAGYTMSNGSGARDGYFLKLLSNGTGPINCPGMSVPTQVTNVTPTVANGGSNKNGSQMTPYPGQIVTPSLPPPCFCAGLYGAPTIQGQQLHCSLVSGAPYSVAPVTGAVSYSWTVTNGSVASGQGTNSVTVNFTGGNSQITVSANYGCDVVPLDTITVTVDPISVNIQGDTVTCTSEQTTLQYVLTGGQPNFTSTWSTGAQNVTQVNVAPANTTTYWVTVTDNLGCQATDTVDVTVHPYPQVNLGNDSIYCSFPNVTLNAGNPGASYQWSTNQTSQTIQVSQTGIYWVDVTSAFNCVTRDSISLVFGSQPNISVNGTNALCLGQSTTLTSNTNGGILPYSYLWSGAQQTANVTITPNSSVMYGVTVTDSLGCTDTDSIYINVYNYPTVNLGPDTVYCDFPVVILDAGNPGNTYQWSTNQTTQTIQPAQSGIYWVDVTANGLCTTRDSIKLTFGSSPAISLNGNTSLCLGQSTTISSNTNGGILPYTYIWSGAQQTANVTITPPASVMYGVTVTDSSGCTDTDSLYINVYNYPSVDIGNDTIICGLPPLVLDAGNAGSTFTWSTGDNTQIIGADTTDIYWVDVTENGCTTRDSIDIKFENPPSINFGADKYLCSTVDLVLDAGNPYATYTWSTGETTQQIMIEDPGSYWVSVYKCGVTVSDTIRVVGGFSADMVYVPNSFTPNEDTKNDFWEIHYDFMGMEPDTFSLSVFTRWGELIKEFKSSHDLWNGTTKTGYMCPNGTYVYIMRLYDHCLGDEVVRRGHINLIR